MPNENEEQIMAKARATRFFSFVVAFITTIVALIEMVDFNVPSTESPVNIPSLITLTPEPSLLAYASISILCLCVFFIAKSSKLLAEE
jgi:hypothetical protein